MTAKEFVRSIRGRACPTVYGFAVDILEKNDWDFRSLFSDAVEKEFKNLPKGTLDTLEANIAWVVWSFSPNNPIYPIPVWHWFENACLRPGKCRDVRWNRAKKALKAAGITHYSPKKAKKEILR